MKTFQILSFFESHNSRISEKEHKPGKQHQCYVELVGLLPKNQDPISEVVALKLKNDGRLGGYKRYYCDDSDQSLKLKPSKREKRQYNL